mmetsp:Transcript_13089/g.47043  ORF Transcript_13089/g.47043 Transcript_13089/m.47043 type:complete len:202 (-) Transcript_13089:410-1015(-)
MIPGRPPADGVGPVVYAGRHAFVHDGDAVAQRVRFDRDAVRQPIGFCLKVHLRQRLRILVREGVVQVVDAVFNGHVPVVAPPQDDLHRARGLVHVHAMGRHDHVRVHDRRLVRSDVVRRRLRDGFVVATDARARVREGRDVSVRPPARARRGAARLPAQREGEVVRYGCVRRVPEPGDARVHDAVADRGVVEGGGGAPVVD